MNTVLPVVALLMSQVALADSSWRPEGVVIAAEAPLERSLAADRSAGKGLAAVDEELRRILSSDDAAAELVAVGWVVRNTSRLTPQEREELIEHCLRYPIAQATKDSLIEGRFWLRLDAMSQRERSETYWAAVRAGSTDVWGYTLSRTSALALAANEGLQEFEAAIREWGEEFDKAQVGAAVRPSDYLVWLLKLRAGAGSRQTGAEVQLRRLATIDAREVATLLEKDPAFREVVTRTVMAACEEAASKGCQDARAIVEKQIQFWKPGGQSNTLPPRWLGSLRAAAGLEGS